MKNRSSYARTSGAQSLLSSSAESSLIQAPSTSGKLSPGNSFAVRVLCGLLLAAFTITLSSCKPASYYYYKFPENNFAGRPIPPSHLAQRVMISFSANGTSGGALAIVDGLRDIRSNIEDTVQSFSISGYSSGLPVTILNFPAETRGYVYSSTDGSLQGVNYSTESSSGSVGSFQSGNNAVAVPEGSRHIYGAEESAGILQIIDNLAGRTYGLNLPNVFQVAVNTGDTIALAMVRNSNVLYRVFKLNSNQYATSQLASAATGSTDCQPLLQPVYCVAPVAGTFDRPAGAYFSLDGTTAYIMNCGPECGGNNAGVSLLSQGPLNVDLIPSSPISPSPVITTVPVPGGVTALVSDGSTLYMAGQQLQPDGLFEGFLSTMSLANNTVTGRYPISDGTHTKILFADNNTLWIGSQYCATGERAKLGLNYNCLTRVVLGGTTLTPQIVPNVTPGSPTAVVPYPNENNNQYYYGSLTGLCWVQNYNKVYTAYGGQVHVFRTVDGSEIDNEFVAVPGTALDVAYMDALTDNAD